MIKTILIALALSFSLSGCAFLDYFKNRNVEPAGTNTRVVVDPKLLQSCQPIYKVRKDATSEEVAEAHISLIGLYGVCKGKQEDSIKAIRTLANIEEKK